jgi:hypothetical protein
LCASVNVAIELRADRVRETLVGRRSATTWKPSSGSRSTGSGGCTTARPEKLAEAGGLLEAPAAISLTQ